MKVHSYVSFFAFGLTYFHCRRASITQWQCWYLFLFSLFPEMQIFKYFHTKKEKKIQRKFLNNFSQVRYLPTLWQLQWPYLGHIYPSRRQAGYYDWQIHDDRTRRGHSAKRETGIYHQRKSGRCVCLAKPTQVLGRSGIRRLLWERLGDTIKIKFEQYQFKVEQCASVSCFSSEQQNLKRNLTYLVL